MKNETMNENISRQAAIDALCNRCDLVNDVPCTEECNDIKILRKLPSTDRKGQWREITAEEDEEMAFLGLVECTNCGLKGAFNCNYCPNCGVYMKGEQEEQI